MVVYCVTVAFHGLNKPPQNPRKNKAHRRRNKKVLHHHIMYELQCVANYFRCGELRVHYQLFKWRCSIFEYNIVPFMMESMENEILLWAVHKHTRTSHGPRANNMQPRSMRLAKLSGRNKGRNRKKTVNKTNTKPTNIHPLGIPMEFYEVK